MPIEETIARTPASSAAQRGVRCFHHFAWRSCRSMAVLSRVCVNSDVSGCRFLSGSRGSRAARDEQLATAGAWLRQRPETFQDALSQAQPNPSLSMVSRFPCRLHVLHSDVCADRTRVPELRQARPPIDRVLCKVSSSWIEILLRCEGQTGQKLMLLSAFTHYEDWRSEHASLGRCCVLKLSRQRQIQLHRRRTPRCTFPEK